MLRSEDDLGLSLLVFVLWRLMCWKTHSYGIATISMASNKCLAIFGLANKISMEVGCSF